ncbi:zinc ribbon domain-containing protein [Neobacillus cucumis]|uniref:Uncharacterized protein n=1 Tax=Neobacillus cucumis TaxID=1740721 RepID=A0A2N5HBK4_9BACI|nr:zinc ribbon domain-containing protein [Neobacillus cucumis]PLS02895.1 hypothetical protein CVD27_17070 [Neobacillus cucumis]
MVILNEEVFDKTQGYVNKRIPHDSYSGVKVKDSFLLSDLIYCGYCGKKLKAENNKNRPVELMSKEKSIELLIKELPEWERRYNESSLTEKSQMLARLVEKVILKKGNFEVVTKDYVLQPDVISQKVN